MGLCVGIDASRNRSGGAIAHMIGLIGAADPMKYGIGIVHVWSYRKLLDSLPNRDWLVKHCPLELEAGVLSQLKWQRWAFSKELKRAGCQIVLNTDAGTVGRFTPAVTMSRDMLSYEPGEIERYGVSKARLRLLLLRYMQNSSLRRAQGAVFLTEYAASTIQKSCGPLRRVAVVPHGVREDFRHLKQVPEGTDWSNRTVRCVYVSNAAPYKHQWNAVEAIHILRKQGYSISLDLIGGGSGPSQQRLERQVAVSDPERQFVRLHNFVPHDRLADELQRADIFLFASSCENMPNTLVEGMAAGLPIACSNRGPMPEVLGDAGVYFDPEDPVSMSLAVRSIIDDSNLRERIAVMAGARALQFSWRRCADETFKFLADIHSEWVTR